MSKNVAFFKRTQKNEAFRTEKNAVPNPEKKLICHAKERVVNYFQNHLNVQTLFLNSVEGCFFKTVYVLYSFFSNHSVAFKQKQLLT